jgi:hypothetical protein
MEMRRESLSSRPTMKRRSTTPSSATLRVVSASPMSARPEGPMTIPAAK